jgi:NTE family protein
VAKHEHGQPPEPTGAQTSPVQAAPPVSAPQTPPQPIAPAQPPTFLNKELPKVGLILGPGGMKAYAHLGVLREFARARIPVHAVAGLEWGAVIGGLFAQQGQVNDAEWKAFKLREQDLPGEGGFLSSRLKPQSIAVLGEFLETAFGSSSIEKAKVDFGCPAYWSRVDRFGWMTKGQSKDAMRACIPYPPFFTDNAGVTAAPFSVDEAAAFLRSKGANLIILVNVLGQGEFLPSKMANEQATDNLLWSEIRREMMRARSPNVHFVINVNTSGHPVTDYAGRRALMEAGAKSAADTVNKMVSQYGF